MSEPGFGVRYIPREIIPIEARVMCPPPPRVLQLGGATDLSVVKKIEEKAIALTNSSTHVRNDFNDLHLLKTPVARVAHALEHIVVLDWLMDGLIDPGLLELGSLAITLPGTERENDIAAVWMRDGISGFDSFATTLLREFQNHGGKWYYER